LKPDLASLQDGLSSNWRHNLKRARKYKLSVTPWTNPDVEEILRVYRSMQNYKHLPEQCSREQLGCLRSTFGDKLKMFRCEDETGQTVALRACVIMGAKAWDMLAATAVEGRQTYASYLLLWSLVEHCKAMGIEQYDLMGVDPVANPGVHQFKQGTGARQVEYLGEWEWSNCALVKSAVNILMKTRSGGVL
jgi:lipid II:glycine glycyltransferase (peptidoglycan interpeptide bridge formation enzyme)